jgi:hypothetical protein
MFQSYDHHQVAYSSSDVIATTCFGHTTIVKWHTPPLMLLAQHVSVIRPSSRGILLLWCYCHNMFQSYDHRQVAYSSSDVIATFFRWPSSSGIFLLWCYCHMFQSYDHHQVAYSSSDVIATCFSHMTIIMWHTPPLLLLPQHVSIIRPSSCDILLLWCYCHMFQSYDHHQAAYSSSDVIATTCFGHTTIIRWHTPPLMLLPQHVSFIRPSSGRMPHDDGRLTETCCGSTIRGGENELLRWLIINCLMNIHTQQEAHQTNHNSSLHIQKQGIFPQNLAIPVTGRGGLHGCYMLRIQHCLGNRAHRWR